MSARALRACVKGLLLLVLFLSAFASQYRFYDLLEIDRSASQRDIKRAFRKMALKLHPDKANDKEAAQRLFVELVEAYETLEDPAKRRSYDQNPHAFHPSPSRSGDGASEQPSAEDHQRRYDEAQTKYNQFFSKLQQSFNEYVRRQEANNWESTGDGSDESFDFEFGDLWDGADEEELGQFKSLYGQHLKTHYSTHEKAVREAVRQAKLHQSQGAVGAPRQELRQLSPQEHAAEAHRNAMRQHEAAVKAAQNQALAAGSISSSQPHHGAPGNGASSTTTTSESCDANGACTKVQRTEECTPDGACTTTTKTTQYTQRVGL